jgi:hypothetical protein
MVAGAVPVRKLLPVLVVVAAGAAALPVCCGCEPGLLPGVVQLGGDFFTDESMKKLPRGAAGGRGGMEDGFWA